MKTTIKNIAKESGVSISTVSKILSGKYKKDKIKISSTTIKKVKETAKKLNYFPNYSAQVLSTGKTSTIGIYMPKFKNSYFFLGHYYARLISSIENTAAKYGYDIILNNTTSYIEKFKTKRIDGIIIIEQTHIDKEVKYLIENRKPFVVINNLMEIESGITDINLDNYDAVQQIVEYLINNNHTKIAFIGELKDKPQKEHILRLEYMKQILNIKKISINEDLFLIGDKYNIKQKVEKKIRSYDQYSGYYGMEYLMNKLQNKFTAVFCANDVIALGAMNFLFKHNIKVPEDISLIGFDNNDFSEFLMNGLTTIFQPTDKMGEYSVKLLLDLINSKNTISPQHIKLKPELIIRGSVKRI